MPNSITSGSENRAGTMWWLSFTDGSVVIIAASSLVHARLLAAAKGFGRASHFVEGSLVDTQRLPPIPEEFVGKQLSPLDARQLLEILNRQNAEAKSAEAKTKKKRNRK